MRKMMECEDITLFAMSRASAALKDIFHGCREHTSPGVPYLPALVPVGQLHAPKLLAFAPCNAEGTGIARRRAMCHLLGFQCARGRLPWLPSTSPTVFPLLCWPEGQQHAAWLMNSAACMSLLFVIPLPYPSHVVFSLRPVHVLRNMPAVHISFGAHTCHLWRSHTRFFLLTPVHASQCIGGWGHACRRHC
jgi:hypothetical protein